MAVSHVFVSAIADGADATLVQPSDWNAVHTVSLAASDITDAAAVNAANTFTTGQVITAASNNNVGLTVKGGGTTPANPGGDLQQWKNSAGVTMARMQDQWNDTAKFLVDAIQANAASAITFGSQIQMADGQDLVFQTSTGTKIGTGTTQKLSFYNATPVAQQTGVAVTAAGVHAALVTLGLITA